MKQHVRRKSAILAVVVAVSLTGAPQAGFGGGSFQISDIKPLLNQQPGLARAIEQRLDLAETGEAARVGPSTPALAGFRVAPYQIEARAKGEQGPFTLLLSIEAETKYLDAEGKPAPMSRAVAVKEKLTQVCILPLPGRSAEVADAALEEAMRQYIRAINQRDTAALVKLMPRTRPAMFVFYDIDSRRQRDITPLIEDALAATFKGKKDNYYLMFFDPDENAYSYRLTVAKTPFSNWLQIGSTFAAPVGVAISYVRWRKENNRWVVDEIGDTTP